VYTSYLLRRSYREGGKVKHENLGNLSHLPLEVIDAIRAMLQGRRLVDLDAGFEVERSLPHGHVAAVLGVLRSLDLERLLSRERCRERDLCVAMICQLVIGSGSKLSMTRRFSQTTLGDELALGEVAEPELLSAMDWLLDRQDRIEKTLARRHLAERSFVLYDLSSSYVEGRCCELAALGHSRDGKPGKLQVNWGLVCSPEGRPVAVKVHPGNTADPTTVPDVLDTIRETYGIDRVILVGDRAMITDAHAAAIKELGAGFVSALKTGQIRKLINGGELQLSLFDETNLAEISSPEFPGERLVVCRNPQLAVERARKREDLLAATERELDKVRQMVSGPRGSMRNADAGKIGQRAGRVINKYKVAMHFELQIADGSFSCQRKTEQIEQEAALDGIYVIRTTGPTSEPNPAPTRRIRHLRPENVRLVDPARMIGLSRLITRTEARSQPAPVALPRLVPKPKPRHNIPPCEAPLRLSSLPDDQELAHRVVPVAQAAEPGVEVGARDGRGWRLTRTSCRPSGRWSKEGRWGSGSVRRDRVHAGGQWDDPDVRRRLGNGDRCAGGRRLHDQG
jgi:Transposase DDE domain